MIRRHVLAALAIGVEAGDDTAAREALATTEWLLRGAAQRRLERALIDAMLQTGEGYCADDPESLRHVQRVAALDVVGCGGLDVRDHWAVAARFAALPPEAPPRAPVATMAALGALVVVVALCVWWVVSLHVRHRTPHPPVPLMTGAFFHGGVPATDPALASLLEDELTQLVIETDADRRGSSQGAGRAAHSAVLRDAQAITSRGPGLTNAWRALLGALGRWVDMPVHAKHYGELVRELGQRAQDVSDQLAALGLGYYVSADVITKGTTGRAVVFSYRVEEVAFVRAGGEARRVLSLRRLDHLNLDLAMLGRQSDELGDPVVLLDQVDEYATDRVLPVLDAETYRLGEADWRRSSRDGRQLASDAADAIDRELRVALGAAYADGEARTRIVKRLVAATVRRHEARHAIDLDRERPLRFPAPLARLAGVDESDGSTLRAELELAAYVSQIANDPHTPQWALWNLASHAFGPKFGGAEAIDAVIVIEGLARQLGMVPAAPVVHGEHLDRDALARLARPLAAQTDDRLRAAARSLWTELYGEPLLPIVDVLAVH